MFPCRPAPVVALALLAAGGCAPHVELARAPTVQAEVWRQPEVQREPVSAPLSDLLRAPELSALTAAALAHNTDLAIAQARVGQARARLRAARQAVLPELSLSAGADKRFNVRKTTLPDFSQVFGRLDLEVDFDLFGRLRAARHAALARAVAAGLQRDAVGLAVESEVASAYVQHLSLSQRIAIADRNIERAVELERVIRTRVKEGDATRVDLGLQSIRLLNLRKDRADLVQALAQTRTALALLTGAEAPQFAPPHADSVSLVIPDLGAPLPRELLTCRPDLRASEALLAAADGDVDEARANFLPQIGLSIQAVLENASGAVLNKTVSAGSSLLAPIFSRGRLEGELQYASALQIEAAETYRRAILTALVEVEDARTAVSASAERAKLIDGIVDEARLTSQLARVQYIEGEEDLQVVLDAEQSLSDAEDAQVLSWQERLLAQIAMYRAIGGHRPASGGDTPASAHLGARSAPAGSR